MMRTKSKKRKIKVAKNSKNSNMKIKKNSNSMNCDENQSPEETKNHIQSPLIEPNNADAEMYQNPNNPVNANIFHHINFYKKPPQRHKQGTFSPSFPSKRIKSNHDHVSVNGNNDNNNINSNSNNEGNNSNINIITHNANFSEPQKDNFDNLNNATNYSLNHVKRLSKSPRPIETTNNQPNIITIPHSLVINDSASNSNTPPTPSKKRRVLDMANTKNERYDKCTVVRRGDLACIYHVIEKELCVKEVTATQARKEYEFAKELNKIPNPNIMHYTLTPPNLLESMWCQNGSYDQYAQRVLAYVPPNSLTMTTHFRDLASGLAHIALHQFVHLDLKPVGEACPKTGIPRLIIGDFGSMVESGTLIDDDQEGDGKYIAPEVFEPNYIATPKFDIFSLALCIVEISTGEQMSNEKWNQFKVWEQQKMEIKKPDNLNEHIFQLVPKMLSLNPSNRPHASHILPILQKHLTEMSMLQNISMEQESKSSVDVYQDESMNIEGTHVDQKLTEPTDLVSMKVTQSSSF